MLQKEIGAGWKGTKLCYLLFAAKTSMLYNDHLQNASLLAELHVPHGFPCCDVIQGRRKKKYPNRYSFHTFRCKLKTGPQQKSHGFIEIARSEWGVKQKQNQALTLGSAISSLFRDKSFAGLSQCV